MLGFISGAQVSSANVVTSCFSRKMHFLEIDENASPCAASAVGESTGVAAAVPHDAVPPKAAPAPKMTEDEMKAFELELDEFLERMSTMNTMTPKKKADASESSPASIIDGIPPFISAWDDTVDVDVTDPITSVNPIISVESFQSSQILRSSVDPIDVAIHANHAAAIIQRAWKKPECNSTERLYLLWIRKKATFNIENWAKLQKEKDDILEVKQPGGGGGEEWRKRRAALERRQIDIENEKAACVETLPTYEEWLSTFNVKNDVLDRALIAAFGFHAPKVNSIFKFSIRSRNFPFLAKEVFHPPMQLGRWREVASAHIECNYPNFDREDLERISREQVSTTSAPTEIMTKGHRKMKMKVLSWQSSCGVETSRAAVQSSHRATSSSPQLDHIFGATGLVNSNTTRQSLISTFEHDDDDDLPRSVMQTSTLDHLFVTTVDEAPEISEAAAASEPPGPSAGARDSPGPITGGKPDTTASATPRARTITNNTPYYEERHERAFRYGDERVVLSGQKSFARLGEVDRVGDMFKYPAQDAYDAYFPGEFEHDEEQDAPTATALVQEYDYDSDDHDGAYFDTPDDHYFSDSN